MSMKNVKNVSVSPAEWLIVPQCGARNAKKYAKAGKMLQVQSSTSAGPFFQPNHHPELVPLVCECLCKPCPYGTLLCASDSICLEESRWCDEVQDCADDEKNCTTTAATTGTYLKPNREGHVIL